MCLTFLEPIPLIRSWAVIWRYVNRCNFVTDVCDLNGLSKARWLEHWLAKKWTF